MDPALDRSARTAGEWLHANSLYIGRAGNILPSFHYINQVISISPDWRTVQWRRQPTARHDRLAASGSMAALH
ncbi:MAG: hypothetical protein ABI983_05830, partial [Acidobacteriota bacterium]